ncbi:MAG TPA: type I-E CRISPR-associated protein Cse2/CasB [Chromatiaceae bacterium]|nr:type I-E CRISPR-associated protein Cse2/CasB [Chromatiaceae bacterium]
MNLIVLKDDEIEPLKKWFDWIHDENHRGERARLRRCTSLDEILLQPGFYRLCQPLPRLETYMLEGLAMVAGLLALVKTPVNSPLPELLGKGGEKPVFSELRFQRLLASDNPGDFFQSMRRAIVQGGEKGNPVLLADEILHWYQQYQHPDWYQGQRQWQYRFAKPYYTQV